MVAPAVMVLIATDCALAYVPATGLNVGKAVTETWKLCRSILNSYGVGATWPACVACNVMMPPAVGVTVKTPATGALIVAAPVELDTTVSVIGKPELADGATVNEPALSNRSAMAAKLTDCQV